MGLIITLPPTIMVQWVPGSTSGPDEFPFRVMDSTLGEIPTNNGPLG